MDPYDQAEIQFNQAAQARTVGASEEDPDEAARSVELGKTFNVNPAIVHMDQDAFVQQQKDRLNATIVKDNQNLQRWVNSHPLAAAVSNDDMHNLDDYTNKLERWGSGWFKGSISDKVAEAFINEMFQPLPDKPGTPKEREAYYEAYPFMRRFEDTVQSAQMGIDQGKELLNRTMNAVLGTLPATAVQEIAAQKFGVPPEDAQRLGAEMSDVIQSEFMRRGAEPKFLENIPPEMSQLVGKGGPWLRNSKIPPVGVDRVFDQAHKEQSRIDIDGLDDLVKSGHGTNLIERSGEMFDGLTNQVAPNGVVHVNAQAIRKMYGDKPISPEDGLLGRVPDLDSKLRAVEDANGDVQIPIGDWIQAVRENPEVMDSLKDHFKARPIGEGGLNKEEVKQLDEHNATLEKEEPEGPPVKVMAAEDRDRAAVEGTRRAAGLEPPAMAIPEVQAVRVPREDIDDENVHRFDINDATGKRVGGAVLEEQDGGKNIHIQSVTGGTTKGVPGFFGLQTANLLRQLREEFPKMETVSGIRAAGLAREGELVKVSLPPRGGDAEEFLHRLQGKPKPKLLYESSIPLRAQVNPPERLFPTIAGPVGAVPVKATHKFLVKDANLSLAGENVPPGTGAIVNWLRTQIKRIAGDVPIYVVKDADMEQLHRSGPAGFAWYNEHGDPYIVVRERYVNGTFSPQYGSRLLLHEAAHAISTKTIDSPKYRQIKAAIRSIMNEVDTYLTTLKPEERKKQYYAFTDEREFLAETFSRGDLQDLLKDIPIRADLARELEMRDKGDSLWDAFRFQMRKMWQGLTGRSVPDNALDAMLKVGDHIEKAEKMEEDAFRETQERLKKAGLPEARAPWAKAGGPERLESVSITKELEKQKLSREEWRAKRAELNRDLREGKLKGGEFADRMKELGSFPPAMEEPISEREVFENAATLGMTATEYRIIQRNKATKDASDREYELKQGERRERIRQTSEWKEESKRISAETKDQLNNRSDIAVDNFLREGVLEGNKTRGRPRLDSDKLTAEQRKGLPEDYLKSGGVDPEDLATHFGYGSADQMLTHLKQLLSDRGKMGAKAHINQLADKMTQARMEHEFGDLEAQILEGAKDHVLDKTQIDELHERVIALAEEFGNVTHVGQIPIAKKALEAWVKQSMEGVTIGQLSSNDFLALAGKADRAARNSLDNPREYLKARQEQRVAALKANIAKEYEGLRKQFDKRIKAASKLEMPGVRQEYANFVHDIMNRIGVLPQRIAGPAITELEAGRFKTLQQLVEARTDQGWDLSGVADFLFDPNFRTPLDKLTYEEFKGINDSIKNLIKVGRDENKLFKKGEELAKDEAVDDMVKAQETFDPKSLEDVSVVRSAVRHYIASSINIETLMNKFDRNNPLGVHNQLIVRPLSEAANHQSKLEREFAKKWNELAPIKDPDKPVDNPFFRNMNRPGDGPMKFTRRNLLAVLQNIGNKGNFQALLDGYGIPRNKAQAVLDWLVKNTTKEDWLRAQALGKIFREAKDLSDEMRRDLSGVAAPDVELWTIKHPEFGEMEGWYHPIIHDLDQPQTSEKLQGTIETPTWIKTSPSAGYTKVRTGYKGPIQLNFDEVPFRLSQILHDVAFKPALLQATKIFRDQRFMASVRNTAGKEFADQLMPYLQDIAGNRDINTSAQSVAYQVMEFARQNMISHLVGLNPATLAKHTLTALVNSAQEVGLPNYLRWQMNLLGRSEYGTDSNWRFAHDSSEEIQRRLRNYYETIRGSNQRVFGDLAGTGLKSGFMELRDLMHWVEAAPLAFGDLLSAVPTWLAAYDKGRKELGLTHGDATFIADKAVRNAHGSTAITFRPQIARSRNPFIQSFASFYGFFSHILQKQYTMAWMARESLKGDGFYVEAPKPELTDQGQTITLEKGRGYTVEGEEYKKSKAYVTGAAAVPVMAAMLTAYVFLPSYIEELVSPGPTEEKYPKAEKLGIPSSVVGWGLAGVRGLSSSYLGIRDLAHAAIDGGDISSGLFGQGGKYLSNFVRDLTHYDKLNTVEKKQKFIRDANNIFSGLASGFPGNSLPRMGIFGYNYYTGKEKLQRGPQAPYAARQIWRGITTGTMKEQRR